LAQNFGFAFDFVKALFFAFSEVTEAALRSLVTAFGFGWKRSGYMKALIAIGQAK